MLLRQPADFWQPRLELGLNQRITETTFLYLPDSIHKLKDVPAREGSAIELFKTFIEERALAYNSKEKAPSATQGRYL